MCSTAIDKPQEILTMRCTFGHGPFRPASPSDTSASTPQSLRPSCRDFVSGAFVLPPLLSTYTLHSRVTVSSPSPARSPPSFVSPVSVGRRTLAPTLPRPCSPFQGSRTRAPFPPSSVSMIGPLPVPEPGAFSNPIISDDIKRLYNDQDHLLKLGAKYGTFDRAGKLAYLDAVQDVQERWFILLTRLQLCNDFQSHMFVQQLRSRLEDAGATFDSLRAQLRRDIDAMRRAAQNQP